MISASYSTVAHMIKYTKYKYFIIFRNLIKELEL